MVPSQKKPTGHSSFVFLLYYYLLKGYFAFLSMEFIEIAGNTWSPHSLFLSWGIISFALIWNCWLWRECLHLTVWCNPEQREKRRFLLSTARACALLTRCFVNIYSFLYTCSLPSPIRWGNIIVTISQMEEVNADRSGDSPATTEADLELRR